MFYNDLGVTFPIFGHTTTISGRIEWTRCELMAVLGREWHALIFFFSGLEDLKKKNSSLIANCFLIPRHWFQIDDHQSGSWVPLDLTVHRVYSKWKNVIWGNGCVLLLCMLYIGRI
jgi:hypothetical protein